MLSPRNKGNENRHSTEGIKTGTAQKDIGWYKDTMQVKLIFKVKIN